MSNGGLRSHCLACLQPRAEGNSSRDPIESGFEEAQLVFESPYQLRGHDRELSLFDRLFWGHSVAY